MGRLVLALLSAAWTFAALAAELEQDAVRLTIDLFSVQPAHAAGDNFARRLPPYRFSAGMELMPASRINGFVGRDATRDYSMAAPKKETAWASRSGWDTISVDHRPSLSALLRFGSPGTELRIRPRRHSISIEYRQEFD